MGKGKIASRPTCRLFADEAGRGRKKAGQVDARLRCTLF